MVKKVGNIRGLVKRSLNEVQVEIPSIPKLAKIIAEALCNPKYIQLSFEILNT